ncbi:hypothetical protein PM082_006151 [Marasmius tenuissimus]|nr:hypothetical protein PM082_006151 [Marasmius tenuissimus]
MAAITRRGTKPISFVRPVIPLSLKQDNDVLRKNPFFYDRFPHGKRRSPHGRTIFGVGPAAHNNTDAVFCQNLYWCACNRLKGGSRDKPVPYSVLEEYLIDLPEKVDLSKCKIWFSCNTAGSRRKRESRKPQAVMNKPLR